MIANVHGLAVAGIGIAGDTLDFTRVDPTVARVEAAFLVLLQKYRRHVADRNRTLLCCQPIMQFYWLSTLAAFGAGFVNAIAGGGTLLTFPALLYSGMPSIKA